MYDLELSAKVNIGKNVTSYFPLYNKENIPLRAKCIKIVIDEIHLQGKDCIIHDVEIYEKDFY